MPKSRTRKPHNDFHPQTAKVQKKRSAVPVAAIFFCFLGLGIAYFATGVNLAWLFTGAVAGAVCGYLFGLQIDRSISRK